MAEIHVLPKHLVNMIAAGEVIERPASVVKELVENALDAGATAIDVTVEDGGKRLISVRDNGLGMTAADLELAFAPHATSKISREEDLFCVRSMGFRGEALASVRSVSQAHILTRRRADAAGAAQDASGHEVRAEGEQTHPVRPAAAAEGTTVTVRNLFFNTPARRKFMRTAGTEFGHVVEQLARLALPCPHVGFTLTHNGRSTHRLPPTQDRRQRAADAFGAELAESLIEFASDEGDARIAGLLAPPKLGRASGRWQYFFVNGRHVRDRLLSHALREAYRGLMEPNRSPVAFVFLELDASEVDVNVHPAKVEVRFRNGQRVHSQLLGSIREALNKADLAPTAAAGLAGEDQETDEDARRRSLKQALADFFKSTPPPQPRLGFPSAGRPQRQGATLDARPPAAPAPPVSGQEATASTSVGAFDAPRQEPREVAEPPAGTALRPEAIQIHDSYIVAATNEGVIIVDQHALHERILFEDLIGRIASGPLAAQRLLIPETVEVSESEKAALAERADLLERLGMEVTEFGPNSVAVQSFPALLAERKVPVAGLLRDLLDLLAEHAAADGAALLERALAAMACKAAVKAGDPLSEAEIHALLARRPGLRRTSSCPHGRPTTLTLTLEELEKQFKRT